jgi:hypothetical protein
MNDSLLLVIEKCKWYQNKISPVMFMIDDLANTWVDMDGDGLPGPGEDWGAMGMQPGSAVYYLLNEILSHYPQVKTTFFVAVGTRVGIVKDSTIPVYSNPMDNDPFMKDFFTTLQVDSRFELAYHGTHHGVPGCTADAFIQEWCSYKTLDEALGTIRQGKEIFFNAVGEYPTGGKYCGYHKNAFSDESIDLSGFSWWCRNSAVVYSKHKHKSSHKGYDLLPDISYFGAKSIVNIPATVRGSLFNEAWYPSGSNPLKRRIKTLIKSYYIHKGRVALNKLIKQGQVVSISEHIAPSRNDGRIQMPNIYTDKKSLLTIFGHLSALPVWYCTGNELAEYVRARDFSEIVAVDHETFKVLIKDPRIEGSTVSIKISGGYHHVVQPDGSMVLIAAEVADIHVMAGTYSVRTEGSS